ncbi:MULTISPECIES: hypothetical protein [Comamonas]|uniref:Uncharacterized protein n=1 Tax=Comamonas testosteroni TK102 TaxID=1392005 RepID=A0A076PP83_COMTE|nr:MULTISPECIES: hypothetical protein [Comamonas]AIJ47548.1 hypothetical protein O987_17180 [Comamonas testosteroni TK102]MPS87587.1 hypothetical protein [Comamonas sp.]
MGFATSLQSLTRRTLKSLSSLHPLTPDFHSGKASATATETASCKAHRPKAAQISIPVMRANRGRSRLGNRVLHPRTLVTTSPITAEAVQPPSARLLKIVQREPRKQPECLLISGRMADVCAALERMVLNEQAARQA